MKIAIMQPYFFPYIGYFQLLNSVDKFVLYDDVNYIKQGWINRNRIVSNNTNQFFTLQLTGASSYKKINEIYTGNNKEKLVKSIFQTYSKAKFFKFVFPLIEECILNREKYLAVYLENIIRSISNYLGIKTEIIRSTNISKNVNLKGEEKVIEICKILNANEYINAVGGKELYKKETFHNNKLELFFIQSKKTTYKQFNNDFLPWLSIIDVVMFNSL